MSRPESACLMGDILGDYLRSIGRISLLKIRARQAQSSGMNTVDNLQEDSKSAAKGAADATKRAMKQ